MQKRLEPPRQIHWRTTRVDDQTTGPLDHRRMTKITTEQTTLDESIDIFDCNQMEVEEEDRCKTRWAHNLLKYYELVD